MASDLRILQTAQEVIETQNREMELVRSRQLITVTSKSITGSADINATFLLDVRYRLVFVRCHFTGTTGTAPMTISLDSVLGSAYDTLLFTLTRVGFNRDAHFRIPASESIDPSPWTFQAGDVVRIQWTNPDSGNITWGLEVGLAIAS